MINGYVVAMGQNDLATSTHSRYISSRQDVVAFKAFLRQKKEESERRRNDRKNDMERHLRQMNKELGFVKSAEQSGEKKENIGEQNSIDISQMAKL